MILSDNDDDYDDLLMMGSSAVSQLATRRSICPTRPLPKTQCKSTQDEATLFDSNQNEISKQCANTPRIIFLLSLLILLLANPFRFARGQLLIIKIILKRIIQIIAKKKHLFFAG